LFTKEDGEYFHVHKLLGFAVLAHFIYRMCLWYNSRRGSMGFGFGWETIAWIALHALLHISSFEFSVPQKRIKSYNIIWPEFRFHSMIFSYRSLASMLVIWCVGNRIMSIRMSAILRAWIVIGSMVLADIVTTYYKRIGLVETKQTTMRTNPYPTWFPQKFIPLHNLFYSASQILATMQCLSAIDIAFPFVLLVAIQTAPFCMTLVKKGVIDQTGWHVYYTIALGVSYSYGNFGERMGYLIPLWLHWVIAFGIMLGRFQLELSKYFLWSSAVAIQTVWVYLKY